MRINMIGLGLIVIVIIVAVIIWYFWQRRDF